MRAAFAAALVLAVSATGALAWNTETEDDALGWRAVYLGNANAERLPGMGWTRNEHTELTHVVLLELGVADAFGVEPIGTGGLTVVDLNAALYQPAVGAAAREGDDPGTLLEERRVPPPAHFAGLPDYSWAVHDWINKNTLCPPLPPDAPHRDYCYLFKGWLGALNANHFGTQARFMYARYHRIALRLAGHARALREALAAGRFPTDAAAWADFVREAELEALVFESVGQHFLEDRWATGHMWERWNGADYPSTSAVRFESSVVASLAAGLLHGSEGITKLPDPMGSPRVFSDDSGDHADPVRWRLPGVAPLPGVGDYRLEDMHDGLFGGNFGLGNLPIDVEEQRARMFACAKAGWSEVIRTFGEREPGRFGQYGVALTGGPFPSVLDDESCWEQWATNQAVAAGWLEHPAVTEIDEEARTTAVLFTAVVGELRARLTPWIDATWRIAAAEALDDPDGTTLARGGIGPIASIDTGNAYAGTAAAPYLPDYTEPEDLDTLPTLDLTRRGQDKHAVYGFFNRAHADWWCRNLEDTLVDVRGTGDPVDEAVCTYLADRAYKGTDPAYDGKRRETRELAGQDVDPICRTYGVETAGPSEDVPYYVHPGYVASPGDTVAYGHATVEHWCRKLPVVDAAPCPGETPPLPADDGWDVVARAPVSGGIVALHGRNFGTATGAVHGGNDGGPFPIDFPIASWGENEIRLNVPANFLPPRDWFLQVCPAGSDATRCSVGRFVFRVGQAGCPGGPASLVGSWRLVCPTDPDGFYFGPTFTLLEDGTVEYAHTHSWSTSGGSMTLEPCSTTRYNTFRFVGTWSDDPMRDFGFLSCDPDLDPTPCPGLRGTVEEYEIGGTLVRTKECDSRFARPGDPWFAPPYFHGFRPFVGDPRDMRCHGGCYEDWEHSWPHLCAAYPPAGPGPCGRRTAATCEVDAVGACPDGLVCRQLADTTTSLACYCVPEVEQTCARTVECPADMTCTAEVPTSVPWLREICVNDPTDLR